MAAFLTSRASSGKRGRIKGALLASECQGLQMGGESGFETRLNAVGVRVGEALDRLLGSAPSQGEIIRPPRLLAAMRHAVLNGGKRLRPFLTIETAAMFGLSEEKAMRVACAIELVHCYSLVHDDLPAMDNDDLRRGQPTVHKAFDEATAILSGDALLTLAFDVMSGPLTRLDGDVRCKLTAGLARASGVGGMAGGQMLDLEAEAARAPLAQADISRLQAMKTGALLQFAAEAGAIAANATQDEQQAVSRFALSLGAAFQIADDLLDAEGDASKLGKAASKDAGRNKATLVAALGVEGARKACAQYVESGLAALEVFGERANVLAAALRFTAARDH